MEVTRIRALRGPNLWSHHTAIQSVVICTDQEAAVSSLPPPRPSTLHDPLQSDINPHPYS
jgi:hypothetical protein